MNSLANFYHIWQKARNLNIKFPQVSWTLVTSWRSMAQMGVPLKARQAGLCHYSVYLAAATRLDQLQLLCGRDITRSMRKEMGFTLVEKNISMTGHWTLRKSHYHIMKELVFKYIPWALHKVQAHKNLQLVITVTCSTTLVYLYYTWRIVCDNNQ